MSVPKHGLSDLYRRSCVQQLHNAWNRCHKIRFRWPKYFLHGDQVKVPTTAEIRAVKIVRKLGKKKLTIEIEARFLTARVGIT